MDHAETLKAFRRSQLSFKTIRLLFAHSELSTASILLVVV